MAVTARVKLDRKIEASNEQTGLSFSPDYADGRSRRGLRVSPLLPPAWPILLGSVGGVVAGEEC
jgi:hypothetical protein